MKTKSFAMLAVSVFLTASVACVAPAMAEDYSSEMPMEQTLADNSSGVSLQPPADNSSGSSMQAPGDTSMQGGGTSQGDMSGNVGSLNPSSPSSSGSDEGSPDTATGDDDY